MLQPFSSDATGPSRGSYSAVLFSVIVGTEAYVDIANVALQDVFEWRSKVAVKPGVDDRVKKTVGVTKPQKQTAQPLRNVRILRKRFDECKDEKWKPTCGKCAHNDAQSLGRFTLV